MEQTVTEQKTTMKRQKLRDYNKENSAFGELGNSPEGKRLVGGLSIIIKQSLKSLHTINLKVNICLNYAF